MTPQHRRPASLRDSEGSKALVCGLCGEILKGRHDSQAEADQAADGHAEALHPDESPVVVVPVDAALVDEAAEASIVALAAQAQERIDRGEEVGPLLEVPDADLHG